MDLFTVNGRAHCAKSVTVDQLVENPFHLHLDKVSAYTLGYISKQNRTEGNLVIHGEMVTHYSTSNIEREKESESKFGALKQENKGLFIEDKHS